MKNSNPEFTNYALLILPVSRSIRSRPAKPSAIPSEGALPVLARMKFGGLCGRKWI
jgi:hypothetical protein